MPSVGNEDFLSTSKVVIRLNYWIAVTCAKNSAHPQAHCTKSQNIQAHFRSLLFRKKELFLAFHYKRHAKSFSPGYPIAFRPHVLKNVLPRALYPPNHKVVAPDCPSNTRSWRGHSN